MPINKGDPHKLKRLIPSEAHLKPNRAFYEGDHWQAGDGWVGPMLRTGHTAYQETFQEIERTFTSANVIAETVERHTVGVVGRMPVFGLTVRRALKEKERLREEEQRLIDEAEAALTIWWDRKKLHDILRATVRTLMWAHRGAVRLYVPKGYLRTVRDSSQNILRQEIKADKFEEALEAIWPEHIQPESSTVFEDPETKTKIGIYAYRLTDPTAEATGGVAGKEYVECVYVDGPYTLIRIFDMTQAGSASPSSIMAKLELGGRITMYEMVREEFITEQVRQQQKSHNFAHSIMPRNLTTGGFLERVIFNAMPPGVWVGDGEDRYFKPDPDFVMGGGTTNFFSGTETEDVGPDGRTRTSVANPSIHWHDPTDPGFAIKSQDSSYKAILQETDQAHILIQGEAVASGKSREQARADFISSLQTTQNLVQDLIVHVFESALALAEAFMKQPGKYTKTLRVYAKCRIDAGPLNADERRQAVEAADEGYISRQTTQEAMGVDDIDAENALIAGQPGGNLKLLENQATVLESLLRIGFPPDVALRRVGFDPADEDHQAIVSAINTKISDEKKLAAAKAVAPPSKPASRNGGRPGGRVNKQSRVPKPR